MFESVRPPDAGERFRSAAAAPFAALLVALLYVTLYPLLTRVPAALFWTIDGVLFLGTVIGVIALIRARLPLLYTIGAGAITLACARVWLGLTFPWL